MAMIIMLLLMIKLMIVNPIMIGNVETIFSG